MITQNDIVAFLVTLDIDTFQVLFIMIGADGSISRLGNGSSESTERDLFVGRSTRELFDKMQGELTEHLMQWMGSYSDPDPKGKICNLSVGFQLEDGRELMSRWQYGSESQGPPPEICRFVIAAVNITDTWYEAEKALRIKEDNNLKS